MNKVEIMGKVSHLGATYEEIDGECILVLRFAVEVEREGSKTQIDQIPCRVEGGMAEKLNEEIENGDDISIKGRWNVDKRLCSTGDVIHYCTCIPAVVMLKKGKERSDDLSIK